MNARANDDLHLVSGSSKEICQGKTNSFESVSDAEIWRKFKSGDEAAFIFIYQKYFDRLVNYCFQYTQNEELIKDCVQDLFIFIRSKRQTVSETNNIRLYLLKSCRNRIIDYLKKEMKTKTLQHIERHIFVPILSVEENIINLQTRQIREKRLKAAIEKLTVKEREIIYYFYFENLDYQAIAELLGYEQVKSTRSLLYKALNKLKNLFVIVGLLFDWSSK